MGDPKDDPEHIPVEKRLSGDFDSPVAVLADPALEPAQKREILRVWLTDIEKQPSSADAAGVLQSVRDALATLDREAT